MTSTSVTRPPTPPPGRPDTAPPLGRRRGLRNRAGAAALLSSALLLSTVAAATSSSAAPSDPPTGPVPQGVSSQVGASNSFSPQVKHTGTGPTGYTVTFRFRDPAASRVQIKGEWYFSTPGQTSATSSQGLRPQQWQPGAFPIAYPNSLAPNWPVTDLHRHGNVWSTTVPLPSGVFTYGFFVNCASDTGAGCTEISDPANPPWNDINGVSYGSVEPDSEVYVPSDANFGTQDYSWQAPSQTHGNLVDVSYPTSLSTTPAGSHPLAIYTPPGYDPNRKQAYPTIYISHGGGGQEVDWTTQGAAGNILDNLISSGQMQPTVAVMTNFNGLSDATAATYAQDLLGNVIPYVERNYDVSTSPAKRAFAGLSAGGFRANYLLYNDTRQFRAYAVMSSGGGNAPTSLTAAQAKVLRRVQIQLSGGLQDPIQSGTVGEQNLLAAARVPFTDDSTNGGHEWYVWRILLHDFLLTSHFDGN